MKNPRLLTAAAVVSAAALALTGCVQSSNPSPKGDSSNSSDGGGSGDKNVTVFISADTNLQKLWEDTLVPAFEKDNPDYTVSVDFDLHGLHDQQTVSKLTAATVQGKDPGFDVADGGFITQLAASDLLTDVTSDDIPELDTVPDDIVEAGGNGGIPYRASSVLLAYNTKEVPEPPKTFDDLIDWIKDNPGKFTYNTPDSGGSGQAFVTTALDKFVDDDTRKDMVTDYVPDDEDQWDKGFDLLHSLNKYVFQEGVYPNGNNQILDLLSDGQIDMAPVWSDQFITGKDNGQIPDYIDFTQVSDPSFTGGAAYLGIPKASTHQEGAMKLVSWVLSPKGQELIASDIAGYPVVALDTLSQDVQDQFADADIDKLRPQYFSSMLNDMNRLWSEKVPG